MCCRGLVTAVTINGPSHRIPKFCEILVRAVKGCARFGEAREGCINYFVLRIRPARNAQQNVRIY